MAVMKTKVMIITNNNSNNNNVIYQYLYRLKILGSSRNKKDKIKFNIKTNMKSIMKKNLYQIV